MGRHDFLQLHWAEVLCGISIEPGRYEIEVLVFSRCKPNVATNPFGNADTKECGIPPFAMGLELVGSKGSDFWWQVCSYTRHFDFTQFYEKAARISKFELGKLTQTYFALRYQLLRLGPIKPAPLQLRRNCAATP